MSNSGKELIRIIIDGRQNKKVFFPSIFSQYFKYYKNGWNQNSIYRLSYLYTEFGIKNFLNIYDIDNKLLIFNGYYYICELFDILDNNNYQIEYLDVSLWSDLKKYKYLENSVLKILRQYKIDRLCQI